MEEAKPLLGDVREGVGGSEELGELMQGRSALEEEDEEEEWRALGRGRAGGGVFVAGNTGLAGGGGGEDDCAGGGLIGAGCVRACSL